MYKSTIKIIPDFRAIKISRSHLAATSIPLRSKYRDEYSEKLGGSNSAIPRVTRVNLRGLNLSHVPSVLTCPFAIIGIVRDKKIQEGCRSLFCHEKLAYIFKRPPIQWDSRLCPFDRKIGRKEEKGDSSQVLFFFSFVSRDRRHEGWSASG